MIENALIFCQKKYFFLHQFSIRDTNVIVKPIILSEYHKNVILNLVIGRSINDGKDIPNDRQIRGKEK